MPKPQTILAATVVALCVLLQVPARSETMVLAADEWCPYNCDPQSDRPGFMVEIARDALKSHGVDVEYRVMPWQRAINEAVELKIDGVLAASADESDGIIVNRRPYGVSSNIAIVQAQSAFAFSSLSSFDGKQIAIIRGYSYGEDFDAYLEAARAARGGSRIRVLSGETALDQMLRLIVAGRIDIGLEDGAVARLAIHDLGFRTQLKLVDVKDSGDPVYIGFGRNNPRFERLAMMLDQGIDALRQSGRVSAILSRYGLSDWE